MEHFKIKVQWLMLHQGKNNIICPSDNVSEDTPWPPFNATVSKQPINYGDPGSCSDVVWITGSDGRSYIVSIPLPQSWLQARSAQGCCRRPWSPGRRGGHAGHCWLRMQVQHLGQQIYKRTGNRGGRKI